MDKYEVSYRMPDGTKEVLTVEGRNAEDAAFEGLFFEGLCERLWEAGEGPYFAKVVHLESGNVEGVQLKIQRGRVTPAAPRVPPVVEEEVIDADFVPPGEAVAPSCDECGTEGPLRAYEVMSLCLKCLKEIGGTCEGCGAVPAPHLGSGPDNCVFCDKCWSEMQAEPDDRPPVNKDVPPGFLRYRVTYNGDLPVGDENRFTASLDAKSPVEAMAIAEQAVLRRKGADFITEFNGNGSLPECEVIGRPPEPEVPAGAKLEPPTQVDPATPTRDYEVTIFLGNREITGVEEGPNPNVACVTFLREQVGPVAEELGGAHSDVPMMAVAVADRDDKWGPGSVRIPLERALPYQSMAPDQQARVKRAMGIETWAAGPAFPLSQIESAESEPDTATQA